MISHPNQKQLRVVYKDKIDAECCFFFPAKREADDEVELDEDIDVENDTEEYVDEGGPPVDFSVGYCKSKFEKKNPYENSTKKKHNSRDICHYKLYMRTLITFLFRRKKKD